MSKIGNKKNLFDRRRAGALLADSAGQKMIKNQNIIIGIFALIVFIKTIFMAAAYPIFSPIDEPEHYDVIHKYARGHLPKANETFDPEVYLVTCIKSTQEYLASEEQLKQDRRSYFGRIKDVPAEIRDHFVKNIRYKCGEAGQGPVYYCLMALANNAAVKIGLHDEYVVYALRFVNAGILSALLITAFLFMVWNFKTEIPTTENRLKVITPAIFL